MPSKDKLYEDLGWVTDRLSTQVRTVALGVLAVSWTLLVSDSVQAQSIAQLLRFHLLATGFLSISALGLDFCQYVAYYCKGGLLLRRMEKENLTEAAFDRSGLLYRIQDVCFVGKQIVTGAAVVWLLVAISKVL